MSIRQLKAFAVVFMLLALAWVAGAVMSTTGSARIQGPSALAVLPDQSVWVSVEDAMWHLDANGQRLNVVDGQTLGVGGRIGNLVLHPNGQLVAQVRNDPALYLLDPETALIKSRLVPQWQADLSEHGSNAINYVFHDDGRVAIATGGGHAVAVFDGSGRFLARTKPGMYRFTNGLWWTGDTLWTTDTNRQELVELEGSTLQEKSRVRLERNCGGWQYLGMAVPSRGKPYDETQKPPLATLVRFGNGMIEGHVTDVFVDGSQMNYPVVSTPEPRDIKWRGNELLMVDGGSYAIKRYSENRIALDDFGDELVQDELKASLERKHRLEHQYRGYLGGAVLLFVLGFAFALRAQMREKSEALSDLNVDLSQLGAPLLSPRARFAASLKLLSPLILATIFMLLFAKIARTGYVPKEVLLVVAFLMPLLFVFSLTSFARQAKKRASDAEIEAVFNYQAVRFLENQTTFWKLRQPDELPREALMLMRGMGGWNLLVMTTQRLLLFVANLRDRTLSREVPLSAISGIRLLEPRELGLMQRLKGLLNPSGGILQIDLNDGTSLTGYVIAAQPARRMTDALRSGFPGGTTDRARSPQEGLRQHTTNPVNSLRPSVASLLIPGLGQWMQRRSGTALIFFLIWLFMLMANIPIVWALWKVTTDVPTQMAVMGATMYLFVCGVAAFDAWRMRGQTPGTRAG